MAASVAFQPVHPAADLHPAHPDAQLLLHRHQLARVRRLPVQEPADHPAGLRPLLRAVPGAAEVQVLPELVHPAGDLVIGRARRGEHRSRVHDHAQLAQGVGYHGGPLCGFGCFLLLEKRTVNWAKLDAYHAWVS